VKENPMPKIVFNKLLGGWLVVRGPHHSPLSGVFASKAAAKAWLEARRAK
jgi:hypothetical protein